MLRLYCLLCLSISITRATAQNSLQGLLQPQLFIKWNPLSLVGPESTVQVSAEYRASERNALQVDIGYGPPFLSRFSPLSNSQLTSRQAWRLRAEYRLYRRGDAHKGRYWAVEGFALTVNGANPVFVAKVEGGRDAMELFPIHKRVVGVHFKAGVQRPFRAGSRFYYDFYAGLGIRYNYTFADSVNNLAYIHPIGGMILDLYQAGRKLAPSVTLGVKLAYRLN